MKPANALIFKIEVTWHTLGNVISLDIDFYLIPPLSKTLFYHIYNASGLCRKIFYITQNIYESEGVFLFTNTYVTDISHLFVDGPFVDVWGLPPLSTMVGGEIKKSVRSNQSFLFVKKDVNFIIR